MAGLSRGQLNRVVIRGYKSIKNCNLPLSSINVLIGSNGAGKSNFISAFSLLQAILIKELGIYAGRSGINSLFFDGRKITEKVRMEFFFDNNSYGFVLMPTDDNRVFFEREFFGYYGNYATESVVAQGHSESKWETGTGNRIANYVIPILKSQNWRVYHFHDTSKSAKVKQEHNVSNNKSLQFDAANLAAFLYRLRELHAQSYLKIVETVQLVAPYFDDFELEPNEGNSEMIVLRWRQKGCEDIFNAAQLSDGTLRFICLATLLLQPHELQPATIIIDEPELGLHPYAITIFTELVRTVSSRKQLILSTQSVELLNEFEPEDVIVVDRDEDGSVFKRLDADQLRGWLESDYSLGDLWKKNILGGRLSK